MLVVYNRNSVEYIARVAQDFTDGQFWISDIQDGGRFTTYVDGAETAMLFEGRLAHRKCAAYLAAATATWARLSDTESMLSSMVRTVAADPRLMGAKADPEVVQFWEYGKADAAIRHAAYRVANRTIKFGQYKTLTLGNRAEMIAWCGGRAPDDRRAGWMWIYDDDGMVRVPLHASVSLRHSGKFGIVMSQKV